MTGEGEDRAGSPDATDSAADATDEERSDARPPDADAPPFRGSERLRRARARARLAGRRARRPLDPEHGAPARLDPGSLFSYPRKRVWLAYVLWLFTGFLGGHRFYLRRIGTAALQFVTSGGLLVWWAVDAFLLPRYVRQHNEAQAEREHEGRPPLALAYLGDEPDLSLTGEPTWIEKRTGLSSIVGDVGVLLVAGASLGVATGATGSYRASAAVALLALVLNLGGRLEAWRDLPVLGDVLAWSWRLRLFYHREGPGPALSRLLRPVTAFLVLPLRAKHREKRRAEVELYLQLGGTVAILFGVVDVVKDVLVPLAIGPGAVGALESWITGSVLTFVNVYAFAVPVGATLARPLLARRPKGELWGLTAWAALCVLVGVLGSG